VNDEALRQAVNRDALDRMRAATKTRPEMSTTDRDRLGAWLEAAFRLAKREAEHPNS
jgi:hypothetical protein